jgi:hypothetical protein
MQTFLIIATFWHGAQQCAIARDAELLGAKKFAVRKAAAARLFKAGPAAIPRLEKFAASAKDPQVGKEAAAIAEKIYADTIGVKNVRSLPFMDRLPLGEFLREAEPCRMEVEKRFGYKIQHFGRGQFQEQLASATLVYLRHLVRDGAGKTEIKKVIAEMRKRDSVGPPPLCKHEDFDKFEHLVPKKNPPWYVYHGSQFGPTPNDYKRANGKKKLPKKDE